LGTNRNEIAELLAVADRDLGASKTPGLHNDWSFNIAYNAALQVATAALAASGYQAERANHHYRVIDSLSLTLGTDAGSIKKFLLVGVRANQEHIVMRLKSVLICALSLYLFVLIQSATAASSNNQRVFRPDLRDELLKKYPGTRVAGFDDLTEYKRKLFRKDHGTRCLGLVKVNFYGDGKPTWAIVLISGENPNRKAQLVVAHQVDDTWETRLLSTTDGTPVVWRDGPGKYEGLYYEEKTIRAQWPVIAFCDLESWAVVFAWTGKEVEKVQISD
jgi:hypothetical protein